MNAERKLINLYSVASITPPKVVAINTIQWPEDWHCKEGDQEFVFQENSGTWASLDMNTSADLSKARTYAANYVSRQTMLNKALLANMQGTVRDV